MVQLKYFGDDRDYFKYDLITHILKSKLFSSYGFIPMLTEHRDDNEGNIKPVKTMCKSEDLYKFIHSCNNQDLNLWERWLEKHVVKYSVTQPINEFYFSDKNRVKYWEKSKDIISQGESLIFYDPDTGLEAGLKTRVSVKNREKYVVTDDFKFFLKYMSDTSVHMFYQHMQFNKNKRIDDVERKSDALCAIDKNIKVIIYMEKDLSFVFILKNIMLFNMLSKVLENYEIDSSINDKYLYLSG